MEVDFAFLADKADIVNGKLYVLGGAFDAIFAKQVPVRHQQMTLIVRFLLSPAELDREHKLEVVVIDGDGQKVISVPGQMLVKRPPESTGGYRVPCLTTLNFFNIQLEKFGDYSLEVLLNGTSVKSVPLRIVQIPDIK